MNQSLEIQLPARPFGRRAATWVFTVTGLAGMGGVLLSLGGNHFWIAELSTHFRVHYVLLLLVAAAGLAVCGGRLRAAATACAGLGLGTTLLPFYLAPREKPPAVVWRLVSANLFVGNQKPEKFVGLLEQLQPDVVVCLEVSRAWGELLSGLAQEYPFQIIEAADGAFGVAVLSRFPLEDARVVQTLPGHPVIVASIRMAPNEATTLVAVHPVPPVAPHWTDMRNRQLREIARLTGECRRPIVLAGDLNTTSWSPAFTDLVNSSGLRDSRRGFGIQPSWPSFLGPLGIPIDHVLVSSELNVVDRRVGPDFGADHRPIIIELGREAPANQGEVQFRSRRRIGWHLPPGARRFVPSAQNEMVPVATRRPAFGGY